MISNLWGDLELYCLHQHEVPQKMELEQFGKLLFYVCPKSHAENRSENEPLCKNKISILDVEKAVNYLDKLLTDAAQNGEEFNLTNYKWKKKDLEFKVLEYGKVIRLSVLNRGEVHA